MLKMTLALLFAVGTAYAACVGPYCYDQSSAYINDVTFSPAKMTPTAVALPTATTTQFATKTAIAAGELVLCTTGCEIAGMVCISTGTGAGAWVHTSSKTASAANALLPCDQ